MLTAGKFDLQRYLDENTGAVNAALERLLPGEDGYGGRLRAAVRYSVLAGGKRLRPVLVLASCEAAGGDPAGAMNTACAFECIHTYSLIHDDLPAMDNDDMRRGRPTCHRAFDEATAILAGDALLTMAFGLVAESRAGDPARLLGVVRELARGAGHAGMIGGQIMDMESEQAELTFPLVENIHIRKTGALIVSAVRSGAALAGADEGALRSLTAYAEAVGLAFQITDDILDLEGTDEELGKPAGSDIRRKKATYPALLGIAESRKMAGGLVEKAASALSGFGEEAEPLRAIAGFVITRRS